MNSFLEKHSLKLELVLHILNLEVNKGTARQTKSFFVVQAAQICLSRLFEKRFGVRINNLKYGIY